MVYDDVLSSACVDESEFVNHLGPSIEPIRQVSFGRIEQAVGAGADAAPRRVRAVGVKGGDLICGCY